MASEVTKGDVARTAGEIEQGRRLGIERVGLEDSGGDVLREVSVGFRLSVGRGFFVPVLDIGRAVVMRMVAVAVMIVMSVVGRHGSMGRGEERARKKKSEK